jgi:hypothetical protein
MLIEFGDAFFRMVMPRAQARVQYAAASRLIPDVWDNRIIRFRG